MPVSFRWILVAIMAANLITLCAWQFFFVNGILPTLLGKNRPAAIAKSEVKILEESVDSNEKSDSDRNPFVFS
jgi:hypothetical protein